MREATESARALWAIRYVALDGRQINRCARNVCAPSARDKCAPSSLSSDARLRRAALLLHQWPLGKWPVSNTC